MTDKPQWEYGRRYFEVFTLALALATLVSILVLFPSRSASALTPPKADYRLQNKLSTSVGTAPALTKIGPNSNTFVTATVDGSSRKVLRFPKGNGVKLSPTTSVVASGTYTIVMLFELNDVGSDVSRFRRIIDFKNGASDNGLYVENVAGTSKLRFYGPDPAQVSVQGSTPIAANQYVQVALTRDDSTKQVVGYVDGVQQFSFTDNTSEPYAVIADNTLRFFRDNQGGSEHSAGSVARIRLFDVALPASEIGMLDRIDPTVFTVNSTADGTDNLLQDGKCSTGVPQQCTLRAAVRQSNHTLGDDTINFAPGLSGETINLTQGHISIDTEPDSVTINGPKPKPGARVLTVSANNASRVFFVADDATATINRLKIINGNTASNGGGISNEGDSLTLINSTVSGNHAAAGGGIFNDGPSSDLKLIKTTVSGNTSDGSAGILNEGGMTLTNSTVSGNEAVFNGGGIFNSGASGMTLTNSTVYGNTAGQAGGGINNNGTAVLRNTIVAGNTAGTGPDVFGTFSSQGSNLIKNTSGAVGFGGSDVLGKNPLLGPLQDNGGQTDTHALQSRSPAIDRAAKAVCPSTDQRGKARPMDGDGDGKARCDIGSFEKTKVR